MTAFYTCSVSYSLLLKYFTSWNWNAWPLEATEADTCCVFFLPSFMIVIKSIRSQRLPTVIFPRAHPTFKEIGFQMWKTLVKCFSLLKLQFLPHSTLFPAPSCERMKKQEVRVHLFSTDVQILRLETGYWKRRLGGGTRGIKIFIYKNMQINNGSGNYAADKDITMRLTCFMLTNR